MYNIQLQNKVSYTVAIIHLTHKCNNVQQFILSGAEGYLRGHKVIEQVTYNRTIQTKNFINRTQHNNSRKTKKTHTHCITPENQIYIHTLDTLIQMCMQLFMHIYLHKTTYHTHKYTYTHTCIHICNL